MEDFTIRPEGLRSIETSILEALFDRTAEVVFFVKNWAGEYVVVNQTLVDRCGRRSKDELLGRTAREVFGGALGASFEDQDRRVIEGAVELCDRLELHVYPERRAGWCLTQKMPVFDGEGEAIGLIGLSQDLHQPDRGDRAYQQVARAVKFLQESFDEPLQIRQLAQVADLSVARFERYIQRIFRLTPRQLLAKTRLEAASKLLREEPSMSVAKIAHACGYTDHSAFSRQFKSTVGWTPTQFRELEMQRGRTTD